MQIKTSKLYVAFTGEIFDTKAKAAEAEIDFLEKHDVPIWLDDYINREDLSDRFRARILHAVTDYLVKREIEQAETTEATDA